MRVFDSQSLRRDQIISGCDLQYQNGPWVPYKWSIEEYRNPPADVSWKHMREIVTSQIAGEGVEFGAGPRPSPVPLGVTVRYIEYHDLEKNTDIFRNRDRSAMVAVSAEDSLDRMDSIADASIDFIIASHVIEHTRNPLHVFLMAHKKLRSGGKLVLVIPDKERTFDVTRPTTTLEHLISDLEDPSRERDILHYEEYLTCVKKMGTEDARQSALLMDKQNADTHFHTWNFESFTAMVEYVNKLAPWSEVWRQPTITDDPAALEFYFVLTK